MQREIILVPYDENWKHQFALIKDVLNNIFFDVSTGIHHIGSTSMPGMLAKPIIDVMVIVNDIDAVDGLNDKMKEAGYMPKGEHGITGRRYFQKLSDDGINHLEHIHCFASDNQLVKDHLMFRDYLMINQDAFYEYLGIKALSARLYSLDPVKYTKFKSDCIESIMDEAREYFVDYHY